MASAPIFISHASADDAFVAELRTKLEGSGLPVWADSRNLRGGSKLAPEIELAIESARSVIVVLSPQTVNSPWVRREVKHALEVEQRRQADGYRVIPLLLPGLTPGALGNWFDEEPVAVPIQLGPGNLEARMPDILAALGERLPDDFQPAEQPDAKPLEELVLTLVDPKIVEQDGTRRVAATAQLSYEPANPAARQVESTRYRFTAPLGPIEADDLRWYLEEYFRWPVGVFQTRAEGIQKKLPQWGQELFKAALGADAAREALAAWKNAATGAERRFSVEVDRDLPEGASDEEIGAANEAATGLLALPWELLHDGRSWLFQGAHPARVRRRLPNRVSLGQRPGTLPIRILLVSPRPEQDAKGDPIGYIDHRVSARPLVEAVEGLGDLVRLTLLAPPTYAALDKALRDAAARGEPFDVVHFDGHGVFDRKLGLGGLCFEDPQDADKVAGRRMEFVDAEKLAALFRDHRVPLVFLEACQSAQAATDPTASVAASLLQEGVTSVVAMSHTVLVETARRFVTAFYQSLAGGARVGRAMLDGQSALHDDTWRGKILGAGDLRLHDWFVPVIYQEKHDPQLVTKIPARDAQQLAARRRRLSLGDLPEPEHRFQGRSRELLALERLLVREPWAVVRGTGGAGKTTLVAELARWLTRTHRFSRAAFVSLEHHRDARAVLDTIGHQLLPEGKGYSVAQFPDLDQALQPIERALRDHATIIVLDNCESVLPLREQGEGVNELPLPPGEGWGEGET
ncbi:MAG: TIR domain-containing protein, partial [Armatimonadota bacterium]|nr:TIR domain-containing protein [Armatimonadota bacterium]